VLALDNGLIDLSRITSAMKVGERGRMALLTSDGRVVGVPKHPLVQNDDDIRKFVLKRPADAGFSHLASAWALWESSGRPFNKPLPFALEGEEWLATFVTVRLGQQDLVIVATAPTRDFLPEWLRNAVLLLGALLAPLVGPSLASPSDSAQLAGARLPPNNAGSWQLAVAIVASSALFASLHFLARSKMDPAAVQWDSGLNLLQQSLRHFAHPMGMVDSFLALTAVGVLLSLARLWTGSIALSVGLHAGWVWVMKMSVGSTHLNPDAPLAVLISPIDGFTGWLVLGWTLGLTTLAWARRRPCPGPGPPRSVRSRVRAHTLPLHTLSPECP
jgi:hypothetical protein